MLAVGHQLQHCRHDKPSLITNVTWIPNCLEQAYSIQEDDYPEIVGVKAAKDTKHARSLAYVLGLYYTTPGYLQLSLMRP